MTSSSQLKGLHGCNGCFIGFAAVIVIGFVFNLIADMLFGQLSTSPTPAIVNPLPKNQSRLSFVLHSYNDAILPNDLRRYFRATHEAFPHFLSGVQALNFDSELTMNDLRMRSSSFQRFARNIYAIRSVPSHAAILHNHWLLFAESANRLADALVTFVDATEMLARSHSDTAQVEAFIDSQFSILKQLSVEAVEINTRIVEEEARIIRHFEPPSLRPIDALEAISLVRSNKFRAQDAVVWKAYRDRDVNIFVVGIARDRVSRGDGIWKMRQYYFVSPDRKVWDYMTITENGIIFRRPAGHDQEMEEYNKQHPYPIDKWNALHANVQRDYIELNVEDIWKRNSLIVSDYGYFE
jgi:hypothetical protein